METLISHEGTIEHISDGRAYVRVKAEAACAGCQMAARCTTTRAEGRLMEVAIAHAGRWHEGQQVVVTARRQTAARALLLAFGLPLVLMLGVLVAALKAGCDEGLTALLMLGALVPYYVALWLLRSRLAQGMQLTLEEG